MPEGSDRKLNLVDAAVLVAATAVGLVGVREIYPDDLWPRSGSSLIWFFRGPSTCLGVAWALALVLLRFRHPRPPRHRVVVQPGFVACIASLGSLPLGLACALFFCGVRTLPDPGSGITYIYSTVYFWAWASDPAPKIVLGAWAGLWLAGRWSPERSWIDRAGRALGLFWISDMAFAILAPVIGNFVPLP
jgi:hypothetical protein